MAHPFSKRGPRRALGLPAAPRPALRRLPRRLPPSPAQVLQRRPLLPVPVLVHRHPDGRQQVLHERPGDLLEPLVEAELLQELVGVRLRGRAAVGRG